MNQPDAGPPDHAAKLAAMLKEPQVLADPVFPKDNYLHVFAMSLFRTLLPKWGAAALIPEITSSGESRQMSMLRARELAFWAIDLDEISEQGVRGRDEFLGRVKDPIRRPPAHLAAVMVEQHLISKGVVKLQIDEGPSVPGEYQICKLKTVGWYAAHLVMPKI